MNEQICRDKHWNDGDKYIPKDANGPLKGEGFLLFFCLYLNRIRLADQGNKLCINLVNQSCSQNNLVLPRIIKAPFYLIQIFNRFDINQLLIFCDNSVVAT